MTRGPGRPRKNPEREKLRQDIRDVGQVMLDTDPDDPVPLERTQIRDAPYRAQEPHPSDVVPLVSREAARQARDVTRQGFGRQERKPIGGAEPRCDFEAPPGMAKRLVNDDPPGRLERFLRAGWQFVSSNAEIIQDRAGAHTVTVGVGRTGGATTGYAMAIPQVLYDKDQAAKQTDITEKEAAILRNIPQTAAPQDQGAFYDAGTSLRSEVR